MKEKNLSLLIKKKQYAKYYETLSDFISKPDSNKDEFKYSYKDNKLIVSSSKPHYCEGIKQMISHYIGALNSEDRKDYDIYLGSILFDFTKTGLKCSDDFKETYNDYCKVYEGLVEQFKKSKKEFENVAPPKFINRYESHSVKLLPNIISYQDFFKGVKLYELDDVVKKFYRLTEEILGKV